MIGYAYVDLDGNVVYKDGNYIDNINPGFFSHNRHLITRRWRFNTEDVSSMKTMFRAFTDLGLRNTAVSDFIKCIKYDLSQLKDAN